MVQSMAIKEITELTSQPIEKDEYTWFRVSILKKANSIINLDDLQVEIHIYWLNLF